VPGGPGYKHLEPGDVLVRVNGEVSLHQGQIFCFLGPASPFHFWCLFGSLLYCMFDVDLVCLESLGKH